MLVFYLFKESENIKPLELIIGILMMIIGAVFVPVNHGGDFRSLVLKNVFFYYLCAVSGSIGLVLICKNIKFEETFDRLHFPRILTFFGANSLVFMAVHNSDTVRYGAMYIAMLVNSVVKRAKGYVSYFMIVTVIIVYVSIMIFIINKFFPFIIGKKIPRDKARGGFLK